MCSHIFIFTFTHSHIYTFTHSIKYSHWYTEIPTHTAHPETLTHISHAHTHANIYFHTYSGTHTHIWSHNVYMCSAYACINSQIFSSTHIDTLTYILIFS